MAWGEEKKKLEVKVKKLKDSVMGADKKLKANQVEVDEMKVAKEVATEEATTKIFGLQQAIYYEHVNAFQKALRQEDFLFKDVSMTDFRFNVNLDVYDNRMLDMSEIKHLEAEQEATGVDNEGTMLTTPPANIDEVV
ncbi:hypothetical protein DEO72_LG10g1906 [Vigna unguiculata]|uniref:Flotillin-like n=1 Tax=Vigna unguiculata TaxID=3917 RepID=A0A4D6NER3_VIGUN|nr:hypothetical protein DEO72_LG10g1906 [Vigna unguiculata]